MATVTFGPGGIRTVGDHKVEFRRLWTDDWVEYPEAHCAECQWCAAPSMPVASIVWDYGVVKPRGDLNYTETEKLDISRWYVKITFTTEVKENDDDETVLWYGVVSDIEDEQSGLVDAWNEQHPTGRQALTCYGFEYLLNQSLIRSSFVKQEDGSLDEIQLPITFNEHGVGNRSPARVGVLHSCYAFDGSHNIFKSAWSTRDIVEYVLEFLVPSTDATAFNSDVWVILSSDWKLDDSDEPIVSQQGITPLALLNRLIDRRRLRSFRMYGSEVELDDGGSADVIVFEPFTLTPEDIDFELPGIDIVEANGTDVNIVYEKDELTNVSVRKVDVNRVDQVIARGARRTTTCTLYKDDVDIGTEQFDTAWTAGHQAIYDAGASGEADYATWDTQTKQARNQAVRNKEELRSVYSWFEIPRTWDCDVTTIYPEADYHAFIDDEGNQAPQFIRSVTVLPYMPLYEGVDYSGDKITAGLSDPPAEVYRRPTVIFKVPNDDEEADSRYVLGENLAQLIEDETDPTETGTNQRWSAYVRVQPHSRIMEIQARGEPQHVFANTEFTALAADRDLGDYDYEDQKMLVTLALQECRSLEVAYPDSDAIDTTQIDAVRKMLIYAGDEYRKDYILPRTVVDIDADGSLLEVADAAYIRDDTDRLKVIARIAYEWYQVSRSVLTLTTQRLTNELSVGDMITTIGDNTIVGNTHAQTINSVITQIRFRHPRVKNGDPAPPTMSLITSAGELDAMTLVPPPPKRKVKKRR